MAAGKAASNGVDRRMERAARRPRFAMLVFRDMVQPLCWPTRAANASVSRFRHLPQMASQSKLAAAASASLSTDERPSNRGFFTTPHRISGLLVCRLGGERPYAPNLDHRLLGFRTVVMRLPGMVDHVAAGGHR